MSLNNAQRAAKVAEMFPNLGTLARSVRGPTKNERLVFRRYRLSKAAQAIAVYSARHSVGAAECYAAIVRSL